MADDAATYSDPAIRAAPPRDGRGPLRGLRFAAKDCLDVAGHATGFGNPTWLATHAAPADAHAAVVARMLDAGAELAGKTHMDELAYSLNGENAHYGTPVNAASPRRVPGGSSSGSATAAARGDVDFALGTDTGGSVRVPASYQGIFGFRPTHGRVPLDGCRPLAPSFDTPGILARDLAAFHAASVALLGEDGSAADADAVPPLVWLSDTFDTLCSPEARDAIARAFEDADIPVVDRVALLPSDGGAAALSWDEALASFRHLQALEVWGAHGEWVDRCAPDFGPGIADRFAMARRWHGELSTPDGARRREASEAARAAMAAAVLRAVPPGGAVVLPTAPGPAPLKATPPDALEAYRNKLLRLTLVAGLAKAPQVSIPCATVREPDGPPGFPGTPADAAPIGVSVLARPGDDVALLRAAVSVARRLRAGRS